MTARPFLVPALLILAASIPLVIGIVPRNSVYGIRTSKTMSDDAVWYPANRFGGWTLIAACLVYLLMSAVMPCDDDLFLWSVHLTSFVLPLAVAVIATLLYARRF